MPLAASASSLVDILQQVFVAELARRQVDRHRYRPQSAALPRHVLRTGFPQRPAPDRNDQAGFFRERNELSRRQHAVLGMGPAQQGFHAGDLSGRQIHLRLVVQRELVARQCMTQAVFQGQPLERLHLHFLGEEAEIVLAVFLGKIHRHIGVLRQGVNVGVRQGVNVGAVIGKHGDADAGGGVALVTAQSHGCANRRQQFAGNFLDGAAVGGMLEDHDELVATEPRHDVAGAKISAQPGGYFRQQRVAGFMSQ